MISKKGKKIFIVITIIAGLALLLVPMLSYLSYLR